MPIRVAEVSVAAATAVVDFDLLRDQIFKKASYARVLTGLALTGSTAGGDTKVDLYINQDLVAQIYNITTGFPTRDHVRPCLSVIPAGAELIARVTDAPATNPINLLLLFQ